MKRTAFGLKLKELREGAGLTQKQLAEAAGTDRDTVSSLELGRIKVPSWLLVQQLADALKVSVEVFRDWKKEPGEE